jgi:hypothetical protein
MQVRKGTQVSFKRFRLLFNIAGEKVSVSALQHITVLFFFIKFIQVKQYLNVSELM